MKKYIILVTLFSLTVMATVAQAHPLTFESPLEPGGAILADGALIRARIDALLNTRLLSRIANTQALYHAVTGRFWQGLRSHTTTPRDGLESVPDRALERPTDQLYMWPDNIVAVDTPILTEIEMHTYQAPGGPGFVLFVRVSINSNLWERAINYGPEPGRAHAWQQVTPAGEIIP